MRRSCTSLVARLARQQGSSLSGIAHGGNVNALTRLIAPSATAICNAAGQAAHWSSSSFKLQPIGARRGVSSNTGDEDWDDVDGNWISYPVTEAFVGSQAPQFTAPAVVNNEIKKISLSDYKGKFVVLFFYPKDFTFVCPTEIIAFSDRAKEFEALGAQLVAASTDTEETHLAWIKTPRNKGGLGYMQIPIMADTTKAISARYGVLLEDVGIALRGLFIINPEGVIQHITINDLPIGRSVEEALRVLQAIQFHREHGEVCPADWKPGSKTMVADPDKSLEYFQAAAAKGEDSDDMAPSLPPVKNKREFEAAINSDTPTVIDFYAPWCGKCRMIAPTLEELAKKHQGKLRVFKFDTTAEPLEQLAADLGVKALPAFRFYRGGEEAAQQVIGYKKRPLEDTVSKLVGGH